VAEGGVIECRIKNAEGSVKVLLREWRTEVDSLHKVFMEGQI
jgi:hypothetical protein